MMRRQTTFRFFTALMAAFCFCTLASVATADTLIVKRDGKQVTIKGEFLLKALDESILFESTDGQLHIFNADEIVDLDKVDDALPPLDSDQLGESLLEDLPDGFKILKTKRYVIAYQTRSDFAQWIGDLYEKRLVKQFEKFSKDVKYKLNDSRFPMAIVVFGSRPAYDRYVLRELGAEPGSMIAHYSQMTNRVAMYDLTFDLGAPGKKRTLKEVLAKRNAIPMVTTIIHEGTHQLMFNRGMQTRLGDVPLWLNEGMANWFETPDLRNGKGWRLPGKVNMARMAQLKKYFQNRPANSIETLVSTDERFRSEGALDAYAESWALMHFLLKRRKKEFRSYLQAVSAKSPGVPVDAETRLAEFTKHFKDLQKLDKAFLKYVKTLR